MSNVWTYWKCSACGGIVRGDNRECPNCSKPIPSGCKYLMPNDPVVKQAIADGTILVKGETHVDEKGVISEVVPEELESDKPNWNCTFCGFQNRFEDTACQSCGAGKEQAETDYFGNVPEMDNKNCDDYEQRTGLSYEPESKPQSVQESDYTFEETSLLKRILDALRANVKNIAIGLAAVLGIVFLVWLFFPVTRTATIQSFEWERSIDTERYSTCHESGWSVPSDGRITSQKEEIHHYNKVLDHYEKKTRRVSERVLDHYETVYKDLGNGQAKTEQKPVYKTVYHTETYEEPVYRKEPVYQTKYYYDIDRWKTVGSINTNGCNHEAKWGETDLPTFISSPKIGDKKQGRRHEKYLAIICDEAGDSHSVEYSYSDWCELSEGDEITYKSFRFSYKPL